ncbi:hypothetical protein [Neptuniibacter halophilus]|uniref:hypothetical protein n=1 Tax=Neptuniibacter halophilus TaxID=651666 RepID=UPI00257364FF|nr:hypothetical protein [Neptuniibacter halophilus]
MAQSKPIEENGETTSKRLRQLRRRIRSVEQQHNHRLLGELRAELERLKLEQPDAYQRLLQELD